MISNTSYIDDYTTKNGAYIFLSNSNNTDEAGAVAKADEVIAAWEASDKTEKTFLDMTEEYSDAGHIHEIIKNIKKDQPYSDLLYAEDAVPGTVSKIVSTEQEGVFVVYYAGDGELSAWEADVDSALRNEQYSADYEEMTATYTVTTVDNAVNKVVTVSMASK